MSTDTLPPTLPPSTTSTTTLPVITAINGPADVGVLPPIPRATVTTVPVIEVPVPTYASTLPETGAGATLGAGALVCVILGWSLIRMARR